MSINKKQIMDFLPSYLKENDYFLSIFDSLFDNVSLISMSKQRNGHYFFTPFQSPLMDYTNFSLFVLNKGISDISLQKEEMASLGDDSVKMRSNFLLSAMKKSDDSFSITSRFITVPLVSNDGSFEKKQFSEKREYGCNGRLISKTCNSYVSEEVEQNASNVLSWDNDAVLEKGTSYYFLEDDAAIIREYRRRLDSLDYFPQYDENRYYVLYNGSEEKSKIEISEDEYQSYYYDAMYKNKKASEEKVKKLEKSFE